MRFLVTGASGFVGSRLTRYLSERGDQVVGSFVGTAPADPACELLPADILDAAAVKAVIERVRPGAVIHLAGLSHVGASWDRVSAYFRVNVLGTRNVLQAAGDAQVVLASSAEVYGLVPEHQQPIVERTEVDPRSPYAMSKAAAELLAIEYGAVIARSFNLIGPGQSRDFALPSFADQLARIARGEGEPVLKVGNLEAQRDFLHVDDAMEALRLLAVEGRPGEAYNIGSGTARSIREVLDLLLTVSEVSARAEMDPERFRPVDIPKTCADVTRLSALGWSPERDVRQAVRDLWQSALDRVESEG
jgi:GDP-4-dehydro-6-deoxy-D-mannose reductase